MMMALAMVPMPIFSFSGIQAISKSKPVMITTVPIGIPVRCDTP